VADYVCCHIYISLYAQPQASETILTASLINVVRKLQKNSVFLRVAMLRYRHVRITIEDDFRSSKVSAPLFPSRVRNLPHPILSCR
jgi:hypothetical protein